MALITRRRFLLGAGALAASGLSLGGYAGIVEPMLRLLVTEYTLTPPRWPHDFDLTIAVLADIHAIDPWMTPERIEGIAALTNTLNPDLILLAGDYEVGMKTWRWFKDVPMSACAAALQGLKAPLGVHAVLGNHDMWAAGGQNVRKAFPAHGIPVLENQAVRLSKNGQPFWLLGLGDQFAKHLGGGRYKGEDDLPGTLAQVTDDAPALLLAHEPDIFPNVPDRVSLTICGHTHSGQIRLPFYGPLVVPSRYGKRYAYGHIIEDGRHLIVSAGLGMSVMPVRFLSPPEIVMIRLGRAKAVA